VDEVKSNQHRKEGAQVTGKHRIVIVVNSERAKQLASGKDVYITQHGINYMLKAEVGCCQRMRSLLKLKGGLRMYRTMLYCPYCQTPTGKTDAGYAQKSNSLKGCKRVKDPQTGKYKFMYQLSLWVRSVRELEHMLEPFQGPTDHAVIRCNKQGELAVFTRGVAKDSPKCSCDELAGCTVTTLECARRKGPSK